MLSDCQNFLLLREVGVAESSDIVKIVARHSEIAVSVHSH